MGKSSRGDKEDEKRSRSRSRDKRKRSKSRKRHRDSSPSSPSSSPSESEHSGSEDEQKPQSKYSELEMKQYLAKKAHKKALKLAKKLKISGVTGYSNENNPFGDSNLTEKFVWGKKIEKEIINGNMNIKDLSLKAEKERHKKRLEEIEKVKKRREERALEKARHEEEMAMLARERARAEFQDWELKEEEFHYQQSKMRAEIRLKEGRAKPIDILAKNLNLSDDFDVEINEPYKIYKGLTVKEMEELKSDIKMHLELDRSTPKHVQFWEAMMVVCNHEISEAKKKDMIDRARVRGEELPLEIMTENMGLHTSVDADVASMLADKNAAELDEMESQIKIRMKSGSAKIVEYWEAVLTKLVVYKAKAVLREIHADLLRTHLEMLQEAEKKEKEKEKKKEGEEEGAKAKEGIAEIRDKEENGGEEREGEEGSFSPQLYSIDEFDKEEIIEEIVEKKDKKQKEEEDASFSPELIHTYEGDDVIDPEADKAELERKRAMVVEEQQLTAQEKALAIKSMGDDQGDAILGSAAEVNLDSQVYWWHDKYRPRKPKYFNRVHTGYEWNKYNQTHYDHDNPPPKIVQGYKFNLFYPDLIDKTKAPTYVIEKDGSNGETCLIRFHAGPPYEDIAFRIVNKEWEYSHKKGFKCTFERGILHVYFNFKRYRYRR